jgi:CSLREA domain-containing protein
VVNTVDDTDDGNCSPLHCSLREAINASNVVPGAQVINFDIPGVGPHVIQPNSSGNGSLPALTDAVTIDAASEPDFAGTPVVVINGAAALGGPGLNVAGGNSLIRGLVINGFGGSPGLALNRNGNTLRGNYVGTDVAGGAAVPNEEGIAVSGTNNAIGGTVPADRNVVSGNLGSGIQIGGAASGAIITGNFIGVTASGAGPLGNGTGINVNASGATIDGNFGLGIDLITGLGTGVTPNDALGADVGPNGLQNFPVLQVATSVGGTQLAI